MDKKWAIPLSFKVTDKTYYIRHNSKYHCFGSDNVSLCKRHDMQVDKVKPLVGGDNQLRKLHKDGIVCERCFKLSLEVINNFDEVASTKENLKGAISNDNYNRLTDMLGKVVTHYSGRKYIVLGVSTHTETGERLVIYKALYEGSLLRAKPLDKFLQKVPYGSFKHPTKYPINQEYVFELLD